ncbi:MAG TPA: hypothetical protein VMF14_19565 [Solirubrobacteraceae bacterium]|nr:hypothetical protein [Solirubrobacteraceae bacterium]
MAITRWIVAIGLVIAGVVLVAVGHWWGALLFLAAGLNGSLAYLVPRWNRRPSSTTSPRLPA